MEYSKLLCLNLMSFYSKLYELETLPRPFSTVVYFRSRWAYSEEMASIWTKYQVISKEKDSGHNIISVVILWQRHIQIKGQELKHSQSNVLVKILAFPKYDFQVYPPCKSTNTSEFRFYHFRFSLISLIFFILHTIFPEVVA